MCEKAFAVLVFLLTLGQAKVREKIKKNQYLE
jgi:hypothetical protein